MLNLKKFRKIQTIISATTFVLVFLMFWRFTDFNLKEIQLSYWGVNSKLGWFWNACVAMLSISIYFNVHHYIESHPRIKFKSFLQRSFQIVSLFLFITGVINMNHWVHNLTAYLYFFSYPLAVFLFAHLNRKNLLYREWLMHLIISIVMVIAPLLVIKLFYGMAISETIHSCIVIGWNLWILIDD